MKNQKIRDKLIGKLLSKTNKPCLKTHSELSVCGKTCQKLNISRKHYSNNPDICFKFKNAPLVYETGFFHKCIHIDKNIWKNSSLSNFYDVGDVTSEIIKSNFSKYQQNIDNKSWNGIILALQKCNDASIIENGGEKRYWNFIEQCCQKYKHDLFMKIHPKSGQRDRKKCRRLANKYNCKCDFAGHSILKDAKFVITFNSTFSVDCMVMGIQVVQYATGYFHNTGSVFYTNYKLPTKIFNTITTGKLMASFLAKKYCWPALKMPEDKIINIFNIYKNSKNLFPLPEKYSYYSSLP